MDTGGNISTSGRFLSSNGSASLPSLSFLNDVNTGIFRASGDTLAFTTGGTERARILSNTFMVGKTSASGATNGVELKTDDESRFTQTGRTVIAINRLSSDGNIVEFKKDNTTVGSIGVTSSKLHIASAGNSGIRFRDDLNSIIPCNANGSNSDNDQDLGSSGVRWRRLYLSSGVRIGGTGTANELSDYEEGTWTPNLDGISSSNASGQYTKIGNVCTAKFKISSDGSGSGVSITGIPFTSQAGKEQQGLARETETSGKLFFIRMPASRVAATIIRYDASNSITSTDSFEGQITYITNT